MLNIILIIAGLYACLCILVYFAQERFIFFPQKLAKDHRFQFEQDFVETNIRTADNTILSGVLFRAKASKGLIFYLHGNAGSIDSWGELAPVYTALGYDVFMIDYRGYGKSEGTLKNEKQLFGDLQTVYDHLKKSYTEDNIIVLGYSIGSGPAAKIASSNSPRMLILQAPYYSLTDMMNHYYKVLPAFILKYKFETFSYLPLYQNPVVIFHGDQDEVIYHGSSLKLQKLFKKDDRLVTLKGQSHNGITENPEYVAILREILSR